MYSSHVPTDTDDLLRFLDVIEAEGKRYTKALEPKWKQADCLFKIGAPEPWQDPQPLFSANLIRPSIMHGSAIVTETKPQLDVLPYRDELTTTARALKDTIEALWDHLNVQMTIEELQLRADVFMSSFLFVGWDREAQNGWGQIALGIRDVRQMLVDPAIRRACDLKHADYVIEKWVRPMSEVARLTTPEIADKLKPSGRISPIDDQEERAPAQGIGARVKSWIDGKGKKMTQGADEGVPRVEGTTYWITDPARDDDDVPLYPNGRLVMRANDDIILEPNPEKQQAPFYDGEWPYEWLDSSPDLDTAWGTSEMEAIKRIQETFNRIGNAASQTILRESRGWVVFDDGAIQNENVNDLVALGFRTVPTRRQWNFRHEAPSVSVTSYTQWMGMCQGLIDYLTGVRDSQAPMGGKGRMEVRSPGLLEGLQQAQQTLLRAKARRLEALLERVGQKFISRIYQFYTVDRMMHFVGLNGKWEQYKFETAKIRAEVLTLALRRLNEARQQKHDLAKSKGEEITGDMLPKINLSTDEILLAIKGASKDYQFRIDPYSSLSTTRLQRAATMQNLHEQMLVPGWKVLDEFGIKDGKTLQAQAVEEAKERAALGIQPPQQGQKKKQGGKK